MLTHHRFKVGDRARFPLARLGDEQTYRHGFELIAFRPGIIVARRLADGMVREVSDYWWSTYALKDRPNRVPPARPSLPLPPLNTDRARPGFYVSILHAHKPGAYILAAGPFSYPGDAKRLLTPVRLLVNRQYGDAREWWDLSYGVCRTETGERNGRFNQELGL
jgi:hypothetical protein